MSQVNEPVLHSSNAYSSKVAFVYVFNLLFGAGVLTLPKAFAEAGCILGLVALAVFAVMSYCTATFMIEAIAIVNGIMRHEKKGAVGLVSRKSSEDEVVGGEKGNCDITVVSSSERDLLLTSSGYHDDKDVYDIKVKVEMGEMVKLLLHKAAMIFYYIATSLYLYGGLSAYAAGVSKSLTTVICGNTNVFDKNVNLPCSHFDITVIDVYRICLAVFATFVTPLVFLNISKSKSLQVFTTVFRWLAFTAMVILALRRIIAGRGNYNPKLFNFNGLPKFFGVAIASYMCQLSLPSILYPVSDKRHLKKAVLMDFTSVTLVNVLVLLTAMFAFQEDTLQDIYTLNFSSPTFLRDILQLFPVLTLSTNFPIIGITLRENMKTLFLSKDEREYGLFVRRILFPLLTVIPPISVACCTYDVGLMLSVTGAYPAAILQYVIPAVLIYVARKKAKIFYGDYPNKYRSPFQNTFWIAMVLIWYLLTTIFVTINLLVSVKK